MNNIFYRLSLLTAMTALLLASCEEKNVEPTPEPTPEPTVATFTIEVEEMTANSATTKVTPSDPDIYYVMYLCDINYLLDNKIETASNLFNDDMKYFKNGADFDGTTLRDYMQKNKVLFQGSSRVKWPNVYVGTTSILYVYGIEFNDDLSDCSMVTDIAYEVIEPERAALNDATFAVTVTPDGADVTFDIAPQGWDGHYFVQIFDTEHELYYDESKEISQEYIESLSDKWLETYRANLNSGFTSDQIIDGLCHSGNATLEYELLSDEQYILVIYAVEEVDGVYQMVSRPAIKNFATEPVTASDMTIDISIENAYVRVCDLKITPSVDDETYIMLFTPTEYLPANFTDKDLMNAVLGDFYQYSYTFKGTITSHMSTLYPSKEYVVVAFGFSGGVVTTPVFKEVFTTMEEGECELSIEDVRYGGPYKISEVAALMPDRFNNVVGMPDDEYYLMWSEIITSKPTEELFTYVVDKYSFQEYGEDIIFFDLLYDTCDPVVSSICMYEYDYYICAAAFDYKGDVTPMWRSELIDWSAEDLRPASEFVEKLTTSPNARVALVRARK